MRRPEDAMRPHAYAIESDSEQSDFEDFAAGPRPRTRLDSTPSVPPQLSWSTDIRNTGNNNVLTALVGPAGEFWDAGLSSSSSSLSYVATCSLTHRDVTAPVAALFSRNNEHLLAFSAVIPIDSQYIVAHSVLSSLNPSSITVVDSYAYHEYNSIQGDDDYPPVRILATSAAANIADSLKIPRYQPPNLLHGITAAIMTLAQQKNTLAVTILLPSPVIPQICTSIDLSSSAHVPADLRDFLLSPSTASTLEHCTSLLNWSTFGWSVPSYTKSFPLSSSSSPTFAFLRKWRLDFARTSSAQASGMYI